MYRSVYPGGWLYEDPLSYQANHHIRKCCLKYTTDNASQTSQTKGRFNESKQWETEVEDGCEDRGGVTSGEDCDKVTVGVVGEVVGEGEDKDGSEVGV